MKIFDYKREYEKLLIPDIVSRLTKIREEKGRQDVFVEEQGDLLKGLAEVARYQSVEAFNRLEGIVTSESRMRKLVRDAAVPMDANEYEVMRYIGLLDDITAHYGSIRFCHENILKMYGRLYGYMDRAHIISKAAAYGQDGKGDLAVYEAILADEKERVKATYEADRAAEGSGAAYEADRAAEGSGAAYEADRAAEGSGAAYEADRAAKSGGVPYGAVGLDAFAGSESMLTDKLRYKDDHIIVSHSFEESRKKKGSNISDIYNGTDHKRKLPKPSEPGEDLEAMCEGFNLAAADAYIEPLVLIPMFMVDFHCADPFNGRGGRMERLILQLLMYQSGFNIGRYVSLEKLVADSRELYGETMEESSAGWKEGGNDYVPFTAYMLDVIASAYESFSDKADIYSRKRLSKIERVARLICGTDGRITKNQILELCPDISQKTVERALKELMDKGDIRKNSGGRYASYTWYRNKGGGEHTNA